MGSQEYEDPALSGLLYSGDDALDLTATLEDPKVGAFDQVLLLEGRVTRQDFWRAWHELESELTKDDLLLIYFAGHGTLEVDRGSRLYLLFSESRLDTARESGIELESLRSAIQELPSRHRVLILDSCYSGHGRSAWSESTQEAVRSFRCPPAPPTQRALRQLDAELFAAHFHQPAMEDPALEHGVYTWFLMEALNGAGDLDEDGLVDLWEAHEHAIQGTIEHTKGIQTPWVRFTRVGGDRIFLAGDPSQRRAAERALVVQTMVEGDILRIDGSAPQDRRVVSLEPGWHQVEVERGGDRVLSRRMRLRRGARLDLGRVLEQRNRLQIGIRTSLVASDQVSAPLLGHASVWWWSPESRVSRLGWGGSLGAGYGSVVGSSPLPLGHAQDRCAWTLGKRLRGGPTLGAGALWRATSPQPQLGPYVSTGVHAQVTKGRAWLSLDPAFWSLPLWSADGSALERWTGTMALDLTIGWMR